MDRSHHSHHSTGSNSRHRRSLSPGSRSHHTNGHRSHSGSRQYHTHTTTSPKAALKECFFHLGLPHGLLSSALSSYNSCDSRLWLLDNSALMKKHDSHVGRSSNNHNHNGGVQSIERIDNVTRWEELGECVTFHAKMASRCWMPTKYWLVNDDGGSNDHHRQKFHLCWSHREDIPSELDTIKKVMRSTHCDKLSCPLASRLNSLAKGISKEASNLSARDKHVTLVICTQGLPTDKNGQTSSTQRREFHHALAGFGKLPCKVIVRLCTDDERVRDMFNTMDSTFENVDVLDDYWGEALEVYLHNSWLTYSMGLHRLREAGLAPEVIDDLDERPLNLDELHEFCTMLFIGEDGLIDLPHPRKSWSCFYRALKVLVEKEKSQWNPVKKCVMPWINLKKLEALYVKKNEYHRGGGGHSGSSGRDEGSRQRRNTVHSRQPRRASQEDPPQDHHSRGHGSDHHARGHSSDHHSRGHSQGHSQQQHRRASDDPLGGSEHAHPRQRRQTHIGVRSGGPASSAPVQKDLTLTEVLQHWSNCPPAYDSPRPLEQLLVRVPQIFPPTNTKVEAHEYFAKWKTFDEEAFADESGDELKELLKRAVRKAKFFLHPDKLPKDLTENQTLLFKTIWNVLQESEAATLG